MMYYILNEDHTTTEVEDILVWAKYFETADQTVAITSVGDCFISTVFLGLDHRFGGFGPPLLFETMIFGRKKDSLCDRYANYDDALAGHNKLVRMLGG